MSHTGDATAGDGGLANTGYLAIDRFTLVQQAAPRTPAAWPHQVGVLPPRAQSFQHRAEVDQVRAAVDNGGTAVLTQVLTGTGGVGKTQLAADYARTAWDSGGVDVLVWISASSRSAITAGYAQAGVDILTADPSDPEQAARAFLAWLEPKADQKPCRWLVVLDDLADPADMRGWWPPTSHHGRALVTTRRREAALTGAGRRRVPVGLFTHQEAAAYFTDVLAAHDRHEPTDQINSLAADLGHLPLALAQAAAHIIDAGLTCASYRGVLADRIRKLADLLPEPGALPDDQTVTVAATWSLSIERANQLRPEGLARPMLQLASFLDPNGIPATVLTSRPALAHLTAHRTPPGTGSAHRPAHVPAEDAVLALRALHRLSLIDHTPGTPHQAVRVHQLVQRATRDTLTPDQHDRLALTAADALTAAWPDIERDTTLAQNLRANAFSLARTAEDALYQPAAHRVLFRTGHSLGQAGQVTAATAHFHRLTEATHHHLGADHPSTLAARHNLAGSRGEAGDAAGAAAACEEVLADVVRVLGPDHPDTLNTRHSLAHWRGEAGDAVGAAEAFAELLADRARVLGPDHPATLNALHNLAHSRGEAGDAAGAVAAFEELLADRLRVQGPDHPATLKARHSLARWQGLAGAAAGAAESFVELLADRLRVLGPDHPDTLTTRHNLAGSWGEAGDAAGAAEAFAELLADRLRVLGPDHPDTLNARHDLARWRGVAGDAAGAAAASEELLADRVRVQGPDHPLTLATRHSLAHWRGEAGDAAGAAEAFAELLADRARVLGPDHPATLNARHNRAYWRGVAGDATGAAAASEELLADRLRVQGPDHPATLTTRHSLARWRGEAGDAAGAAAAFEKLLADRLRVLGPEHPATLLARDNLAYWWAQTRNSGVHQSTDHEQDP
ncbi:ferritin-like protein [Streptomyces albaduncus]|uniref:Ferritin-like protein n=1 Tax=Streptomyces griseoloalbus TaxID=67303 RepID=A0A7W8BMM5_9ACTN|nr:FxSxx-COOH system tetratricopeptide repeat protein [Streptomyces albaduncus]MBB5125682.1 ferritin-like protein [Streptomyces albaduncus]